MSLMLAGTEMHNPESDAGRARDWTAQFASRLIWWVLPALLIVAASSFRLSLMHTGFVFAGGFAWMGTGCALNAWRCGRLHCYFTGPVLWLGATGTMLAGFRVLSGAHDLNYSIYGTIALVVVSYIPEVLWGKYARIGLRGRAPGIR